MATLGVFRDDVYDLIAVLPGGQYKTSTQNGGTLVATNFVGAQENYFALSGQTTAQALTTDTAANIIAAFISAVQANAANYQTTASQLFPVSFVVTFINNNTSSGAITLSGGTGVTITGTNTIAITTSRTFLVTVTSPTTVTFQNVGSGTP